MNVTVINPDAPFDSPSYDGEPAGAHLILAPGTYRCEYVDGDDTPLWGTLTVTDDESHMAATTAPVAVAEVGQTTTVIAEDAPIGVLLWPVRAPQYAPNYTIGRVEIIRTANQHFVRWIYESGTERVFQVGEAVAVRTHG